VSATAPPVSLWDPMYRPRRGGPLLATWSGTDYTAWSWADWHDRASRFAGGLRQRGVQPGDRVAFVLTNAAEVCAGVLGAWLAGACVISMPVISRGMAPPDYFAMLRRVVAHAQPGLVVAEAQVAALLRAGEVGVPVMDCDGVHAAPPETAPLCADEDPVFVQYTSGSTSEPRGCVVTAAAVARQLSMLEQALRIDPERDVGVVWLPLSHDMGLFGCLLLTYWTDHRLVLSTPERFLRQPGSWFEDCAHFGGTISAAPSFGLDRAARVAEVRPPASLTMERLVVGSDRVEASVLRRAARALGPERLPESSLVPAYGLAEAVLAVTMSPVGEGPTVLRVERAALEHGDVEPADSDGDATVELVSAGLPLPGNVVKIDPPTSAVGEVVVSGPTLAVGYLGAPQETAERFTADGLRTGDFGFVHDGRLYVTGRSDDLMIMAGRNLYARDVEAALAGVPGLRPGRFAVVDVEVHGDTRLVALIEPMPGHPDFAVMARDVATAARAAVGVTIAECVFVAPGDLPKTPSGKIQRFRCREHATSRPRAEWVVVRSR
jgi:acyl-CoA synthetase (AMP-forming)/AMP-acid ligase II